MQQLLSEDNRDEAEALLKENLAISAAVYDYLLANLYFQETRSLIWQPHSTNQPLKWPRYLQAWQNLGIVQIKRGVFQSHPGVCQSDRDGRGRPSAGLLGFAHSSEASSLSGIGLSHIILLIPQPKIGRWAQRAFFDLKRWDDAIALTGNMLESDPESAQLWILQANAYIGLEKPMKAAENFEIVDRLGKHSRFFDASGDIYLNSELLAPAVDVYLRVLKGEQPELGRLVRNAKILSARNANDQSSGCCRPFRPTRMRSILN